MSNQEDFSNQAMYSEEESDAQILWNDVCGLLEGQLPAPTISMFKSCKGLSIDGDKFIIGINSGFVQRNIENNKDLILSAIERIAFQEMKLGYQSLNNDIKPLTTPTLSNSTTISFEEFSSLTSQNQASEKPNTTFLSFDKKVKEANPLVENVTHQDSLLTFETFVEGDENRLAHQAAKNVANGSKAYNPLFIYGNSGLGKTHLLKAIQNYIQTNDRDRQCVYKQGSDFVSDYTSAMNNPDRSVREELSQNYRNIDVLIIDDIQNMKGAVRTVDFFFETFNSLMNDGKQIILAADETPRQIGFDERVSSRLDSGFTIPIQPPNYEMRYNLLKHFYEQMKEDAIKENIKGFSGTISDENLDYMAHKSGTNIRLIKSFCQACLMSATRKQEYGQELTQEDINKELIARWGLNQRTLTIDQVQRYVEQSYNINHSDLISNKRNKDLMEPRHVGVWLARDLTEATLAQIGERFGGRTHATVKHSIKWVEDKRKEDRIFFDKTQSIREGLLNNS